jgi:antitoxin (DNA-binding transcriptional repressor) of toxin-antitoxin stability system
VTDIYNIYEAKTHFSQMLERATVAGEVVIAKAGKPLWKIVRISDPKPERVPGRLKGKIWVADDFDDPLPDEVLKEFYGGEIPDTLVPPKKKSRKK